MTSLVIGDGFGMFAVHLSPGIVSLLSLRLVLVAGFLLEMHVSRLSDGLIDWWIFSSLLDGRCSVTRTTLII